MIHRKKWDDKYRNENREKCRKASRLHYSKNIEEQRERSMKKYRKERIENSDHARQRARNWSKTPRGIFNAYKKNSRKRGIVFEVSREDFVSLIGSNCAYCGSESFGVDRVNNDLGYIYGNILPCCAKCNHMKRDFTAKEFLSHCRKIVSRNEGLPENEF